MADEDSTEGQQQGKPAAIVETSAASGDRTWEEGKGKGSKDSVLAELADMRRARKAAEKELSELRAASMSEQEKAVAEAEQRGRSAAVATYAGKLAGAELRAAAAGRVPKEALDAFLEYADVARFVGEDGELDRKAIDAAVRKLAANGNGRTDFDGGIRTPAAKPGDMNSLIRGLAGVTQ